MRGGLLLSTAPDFFRQVREALVGIGAIVSDDGDDVWLEGDFDSRAYVYANPDDDSWRIPEPVWAEGVPTPDAGRIVAVMVECRGVVRVAELSRAVAKVVDQPVWFLDDCVAWPAASIDARQLRL